MEALFIVCVCLIVAWPIVAVVSGRRRARREREQEEKQHAATMKWYEAELSKWQQLRDARAAELAKLIVLPWPMLRAACEAKTGMVCECSTKQQVAQKLVGKRLPPPPVIPPPPLR